MYNLLEIILWIPAVSLILVTIFVFFFYSCQLYYEQLKVKTPLINNLYLPRGYKRDIF